MEVPGLQIDRRCGSGLQAVITAAMQVQTGASDLVLAGGVESMSQAEFYTTDVRWGVRGAGTTLHDRLARGRVTSGGVNHPVPGRHAGDRREPAPRVRHPPRGTGPTGPALAREGRRGPAGGPVRRRDRARHGAEQEGRDRRRHRRTPAPRLLGWRSWRGCVPSSAARTRRRPSPRATPAGRTTAPRSASSPTPSAPPSSACARWPAWSPGPSSACRPRRWASARCPPPPGPWNEPGLKLADIDLIELERGLRRPGARLYPRMGL